MRRRNYLGALAVAAVAGCLDDDQPEPAETETETEPETEPEAPEPEAETETEQELSESEQIAADRIAEGDERLGEALTIYADSHNVDSFLAVRASVTEFRWVPVAREVRAANEAFDRASRRANDEQQRQINRLRRVGQLIREAARTQESLGVAFRIFGDIVVAHQGDTVSPVAWRRLRDQQEIVTRRLDAVEAAGNAADAEASAYITVEEYETKLTQQQQETDTFQRLLDGRTAFTDGHNNWLQGVSRYRNRNWSAAESRFSQAATNFENALGAFGEDSVDDTRFDRRLQTFHRMAESLGDAAVEYSESAAAYDDRNAETGDDRRRAGRRILRNEDAVAEIPSVIRLETFVP